MNRRRRSNAISLVEAEAMIASCQFAQAIGKPLQWMLTVRLPVDTLDETARCDAFLKAKKRVSIAFSRAGAGPLWAIWCREVSRRDGQEHMHLLAHAPLSARKEILATLRRWWPQAAAVDGRDMPLQPHLGRNRKLRCGPGYLMKQLDRAAALATNFNRVASGGSILGRRAGVTTNLGAKAIAAHAAATQPPATIVPFLVRRPKPAAPPDQLKAAA